MVSQLNRKKGARNQPLRSARATPSTQKYGMILVHGAAAKVTVRHKSPSLTRKP